MQQQSDEKERTRLMWVWSDMKRRCHNENHHAYANYGGRGISVCERWRGSFESFLEDMGVRPDPRLTLERVDNNAGYSPDNCVWASRLDQGLNKRDYRNNSTGQRNIERETKVAKGHTYTYWRVRVRREGEIIATARFKSMDDAIRFRDRAVEEYRNARA